MKENMGLCFFRGWLVYGYKHGRLRWMPMKLQSFIVHIWNSIVCLVKGHDTINFHGSIECVHCCKKGLKQQEG